MLKKAFRFIWKTILWFFVISILWVLTYRFVPPPISYLMVKRVWVQYQEGKALKLKKDWEPVENISPYLVTAIIASEDQLFMEHNGFDWKSIKRAYYYNQRNKGEKMRGGSTISQQVAKNVFLWPGRSYVRKALEAYFTFLIELIWPKKRIMEVYINVVEMGQGVYGAEAAAHYYYGKSASDLSRSQAALIAAILPNPREWRVKNPGPYVRKRQAFILRNMNYIGKVEFK